LGNNRGSSSGSSGVS